MFRENLWSHLAGTLDTSGSQHIRKCQAVWSRQCLWKVRGKQINLKTKATRKDDLSISMGSIDIGGVDTETRGILGKAWAFQAGVEREEESASFRVVMLTPWLDLYFSGNTDFPDDNPAFCLMANASTSCHLLPEYSQVLCHCPSQ